MGLEARPRGTAYPIASLVHLCDAHEAGVSRGLLSRSQFWKLLETSLLVHYFPTFGQRTQNSGVRCFYVFVLADSCLTIAAVMCVGLITPLSR